MYKPNIRRVYVVETPEGNIWVHPSVGRNPSPRHVGLRPHWITGPKCPSHCAGPDLTDVEIAYYLGAWLLVEVARAEKSRADGVYLEEPPWY